MHNPVSKLRFQKFWEYLPRGKKFSWQWRPPWNHCLSCLQNTEEKFQKKILNERIARLSGGIAILQVIMCSVVISNFSSWRCDHLAYVTPHCSFVIDWFTGRSTNTSRVEGQTAENWGCFKCNQGKLLF